MSFAKSFIFVAIASAPLMLAAQQKISPPDPAETRAPVAAYQYESAFNRYKPMGASASSPDSVWRPANKDVDPSGGSDAGAASPSGNVPMSHSTHQNNGK